MDQPFRLSLYLRRLGRHWKLIIIPAIIALLVAVLFSFLTPTRYTARTTMIAPKPQLVWRWENKVYDIVDLRFDWRAEVMPLVKTQKVAELALAQAGDQLSQSYTPQEVMAATSVKPGAGTLFTISVKAEDAHDAMLLANAVAGALPIVIADIYAGEQDAFAEAEADVKKSFADWDEQWRAFRAQYGIGLNFTGDITGVGEDKLYGNQSAIKQELTIKSSDVANLTIFLNKIMIVLTAIDQNDENIHLAILDTPDLARYGLDFETLQGLSPRILQETLETLRPQVQADVDTMTADLLALQESVANILQERENIQRTRNIWYDSVKTMENKQVEMEVKRIVEGQRVHQVDEAQVPARPSQPNWLRNLTLALIAGLLGGLFLAVIAIYLGGDSNAQT
jgi:capsular polysaccharide biosynthesis protein